MGEKRDAYIAKLKAKLDEWNAQIGRLETKASNLNTESKAQLQRQVEHLRTARNELEGKFHEVKSASELAWATITDGVDAARDALDEAVKSAFARFR